MEHFQNARVVRLRSRHDKYLTADDDAEDAVRQSKRGASLEAKWEVELVEGRAGVIRLKNCRHSRYLAASGKRLLLGATGRKVVLLPLPVGAPPRSLGETVEWQPVRDGPTRIKLRTRTGSFLRANGSKLYRDTVTHDNPSRTYTQDRVFWEVDVVQMADIITNRRHDEIKPFQMADIITNRHQDMVEPVQLEMESVSGSSSVDSSARRAHASALFEDNTTTTPIVDEPEPESPLVSNSTVSSSPPSPSPPPSLRNSTPPFNIVPPGLSRKESLSEERLITYYCADDDGEVDDSLPSGFFQFHGSTAQELIHDVEKEADLDGFILCKRNVLNDKLYRVRINLPLSSDHEPMTVFIVHPTSKVAKNIF